MRSEDRKSYLLIKDKVEVSGIDSQFEKYDFEDYETAMRKAYSRSSDKDFLEFLILRQKIRTVIENDLMWFDRWVTAKQDYTRIEACHEHCYYYMQHGIEPPNSYYSAAPAIFQFNPKYRKTLRGTNVRVDKQVVLLPRTLGKTVLFLAQAVVQNFMKNPRWKFYLVQGNEKKAKDNLNQIQKYLMNPWLAAVAPDLFATEKKEYLDRGGKINRFTIDMPRPTVEDISDIMALEFDIRREATFTIGTPKTSATGLHFDCVYFDDIVDENTSKTPEAMEELSKWHGSIMSLANETGILERHYTGTRWYEYDLYDEIMKGATVFVMPAMWEHNGKVHYLSAMHNADVLEDLKTEKGTGEWFDAHMQMIKRSVEQDVRLVSDDSFIFSFPHERLSKYQQSPEELPLMKLLGCVVSSFDPTYSSKGKGKRTNESKATLINGVIYEGTLYVYDMWQSLGWDLENTKGPIAIDVMNDIYVENTKKHGVDITVCDAQGTQKANTQKWFSNIEKECDHIECSFHMKGSLTGTDSKAERANIVLREKFASNDIKIHHSLEPAIKEIMRKTKGYDFIDDLIQLSLPDNVPEWLQISEYYKMIKAARYKKRKRKLVLRKSAVNVMGY